jgi:hypothetical protein
MNLNRKVVIVAMLLSFLILSVGVLVTATIAGEKEELNLELRALVAEYNLAFTKFQQASPEYKAIDEFFKKIDTKGLSFVDGKIVEKPKAPTPEKKVEPPKGK